MRPERVYVLGAGAIGMPLAVHLALSGRQVTAVRTSTGDLASQVVDVTIVGSEGREVTTSVAPASLARLPRLAGVIVVTAKSYANQLIAATLRSKEVAGPLVIMQNGVGVEDPYLALDRARVYRCVLYATGQKHEGGPYHFVPITASPIGAVRGDAQELDELVDVLNTPEFPFVAQGHIQQEVWKKAAINAAFNSICPLLEVDNGIFVRDERSARLARAVVDECCAVMHSLGIGLSADDIMQQLFAISERSAGQLISTLQDLNQGRETEIDYLNLEIARIAGMQQPAIAVPITSSLGAMIKIKSLLRRKPPS